MQKGRLEVGIIVGENGKTPEYKTQGSAGADMYASSDVLVPAGGVAVVSTNIFIEIPEGYEAQVRSRSGLAAKNGIFVLNSPGTIDSDYRKEIKIILANFSKDDFKVEKGMRIAQLVLAQFEKAYFTPKKELSKTTRQDGLGHSGLFDKK